jgi:hypothetical protein
MGNHPGSDGGYARIPERMRALPLVEREAALKKEAVDYIVSHPGDYIGRIARRGWITLRSDTIAAVWNEPGIVAVFGRSGVLVVKVLCIAAYYGLLLTLALALFARARASSLAWQDGYLIALALACAAPFLLIVGGNRYHLPLLPLLSVWAAGALAQLPATHRVRAIKPQLALSPGSAD